eukprot:scaffold18682_cov144-Isochrysis_galbana.AAC.3
MVCTPPQLPGQPPHLPAPLDRFRSPTRRLPLWPRRRRARSSTPEPTGHPSRTSALRPLDGGRGRAFRLVGCCASSAARPAVGSVVAQSSLTSTFARAVATVKATVTMSRPLGGEPVDVAEAASKTEAASKPT